LKQVSGFEGSEKELILDIFNPCGAHNEAVLAARYFSAFSPT